MQHRKPAGLDPRWRIPEPPQALVTLTAMVATVVVPLFLLTSLIPRPLVLPVLCLIAIASAAMVSFFAWHRGLTNDRQRITAWDIAGALAFVGVAAAILSNPDQVALLTNADALATFSETPGRSQVAMSDRQ
jgi:hypothetical protein